MHFLSLPQPILSGQLIIPLPLSVCLSSRSLSLSPSASPVIIATWKVFALERRTKSCSCARMLLSLRACFPGLCSSLLCHCQDRNESQQPSCERSLASKSIVACIRHLRLNSCASRGLLSRCTDSLHSRDRLLRVRCGMLPARLSASSMFEPNPYGSHAVPRTAALSKSTPEH